MKLILQRQYFGLDCVIYSNVDGHPNCIAVESPIQSKVRDNCFHNIGQPNFPRFNYHQLDWLYDSGKLFFAVAQTGKSLNELHLLLVKMALLVANLGIEY